MTMRALRGVLLIIVGLFLLIQGIQTVNEINRRNDTLVGRLAYNLNDNYQKRSNGDSTIGYLMAIAGGILILFGLKQFFGQSSDKHPKIDAKNETALDYLYRKLNNVVKDGDYKTAIAITHKILNIDPSSKEAYFNLACLYSLTEKEESLYALSKAIENGYTNIEKIKTYPDLAWIRRNPKFNLFVQNGYRLPSINNEKGLAKELVTGSEETVSQLERLGRLKEQGLLTEDEFRIQKNKVLGNIN